jgi:hypothetical protein
VTRNAGLQEQLTALERNASLDRQTEVFLQKEIRTLQDESFRLKGELAFYKGVMEAAGQAKGLVVQDIYVRKLPNVQAFQLNLVLTNVPEDDALATGVMAIQIEGRQNGAARILSLSEVTLDAALDLGYQFRNFKRFDTNLQLPPEFVPQRVLVELQPADKKAAKIRKTFDWPATAG